MVTEASTELPAAPFRVGIYWVLSLSAGVYAVKALKEGFASAEQAAVVVALNEMKVDFTLRAGGVTKP